MTKGKKTNGKKKGSSFELKICKEIAEAIGEPYGGRIRRTPGSGALVCRADIYVHKDIRHKFNWFLELKKRENIRLEHLFKPNNYLLKWYKDSKEKLQIDPEYDPMTTPSALVFSKNQMSPFILMSREDFATTDVFEKYTDYGHMIFFTDDEVEYVVLDWETFLNIYRVNPLTTE